MAAARVPQGVKVVIALVFLVSGSSLVWHSVGEYQVLARQLAYIEARNRSYDDVGNRLSMRFAQQTGTGGEGLRRMELQRQISTWSMLGLFGCIAAGISGVWLATPLLRSLATVLEVRRQEAGKKNRH